MQEEYKVYLPKDIPNNFLSVREYGWRTCLPKDTWTGHKPYYVIHLVISGYGTFELNGKTHLLGEGDGFAISPEDYVTYQADDNQPWKYTWVAFSGLNAAHLLHMSGLTKSTVFRYDGDKPLAQYFYDLCSLSDNTSAPEIARIGYLHLIFSNLIHHTNAAKDIKNKDFLTLAIEYMEQNFEKNIGIEDIFKHFNVSRSQLYRLFKEKMNISPIQYLNDMRFSKACLLLEGSDMPIYKICITVGFNDPVHFSKAFKRKFEVSPYNYRRIHSETRK